MLRFGEISALVPDLRQEKPGPVADLGVDVIGEQALENLRGIQMVTVRQIKSTEKKLGFVTVVFELRLLLRSQQSYNCREILSLIEVEQYFAVVRIFDDGGFRVAARSVTLMQWCRHCNESP